MPDDPNLLAAYLAIHPTRPEEQALRLLVDLGRQIVGADESSLLVVDQRTGELVFVMTTGSDASEATLRGQRIPSGQGLTGLAVLTREVQIGAPTYTDLAQTERVKQAGSPKAVLAAPMLVDETVIGTLTAVSFRADKRFTAADGDLSARLAAAAAVIVDQRRHIDAIENASSAADQGARGVTDAEQRVMSAFSRIVQKSPGSLEQVARLLEAIEALVLRP
jgi:transcriptional regulator with GAF, ATPase, and Fis domain